MSPDTVTDPFGPEAHSKYFPLHSGKRAHYCWEWDGMYICEDCPEFECCECFTVSAETKEGE